MTQWVENPTGGRARGPIAVGRAWIEVLLRPRRFFESGVAPGDQAPGLVFAACVVAIEETIRFALVPGVYPVVGDRPLATGAVVLAAVVVLLTPLALHFAAALQTLGLLALSALGLLDERAGVSQSVQVIAYATAPCVFAGVPVPALRLACAVFGAGLLVIGTAQVHEVSLGRSVVASVLPGVLVFGYAFRGFAAATALVGGSV